jgi:hypothetical protein
MHFQQENKLEAGRERLEVDFMNLKLTIDN